MVSVPVLDSGICSTSTAMCLSADLQIGQANPEEQQYSSMNQTIMLLLTNVAGTGTVAVLSTIYYCMHIHHAK